MARHITARCLSCDALCAYCRLPVRLDPDDEHPGHGVVDTVNEGYPGLGLLHRFCQRSMGSRSAARRGLVVRRAYLGRATERYEARLPTRPYDRLGVCPGDGKRWRVAKMRYACKACRYYTSSH
ncbi:hypothetical protein ACFQ1S_25195 [Kibdelosporangium lantanae]|uniref:HNH endonuclease n=1 Tax=Kibdelosporangium lantanae TaxID=1497396 RepID=A0ABW3MD77_9PSEU